jgi:hypothetical protein
VVSATAAVAVCVAELTLALKAMNAAANSNTLILDMFRPTSGFPSPHGATLKPSAGK